MVAVEEARFPQLAHDPCAALAEGSARVEVDVVAVLHDCTDGFGEAFLTRPEAFLRPEVRAATSGLALTDPEAVQRGLARLEADLSSEAWDHKYGHLRAQTERRGAIRLITANT